MDARRIKEIVSIVAVSVALVGGGLLFRQRAIRNAQWAEVTNSIIGVEVGIRHEPIITLRSKIAELDASLTRYVYSDPSRVHEQRVSEAKEALESIESALTDQNQDMVYERDWPKHSLSQLDSANSPGNYCDIGTGLLYMDKAELATAEVKATLILLAQSKGEIPRNNYPPLDLASAKADCAAKNERARTTVLPFVHPCWTHFQFDPARGKWCWSDPSDGSMLGQYGVPFDTKEHAIEDAIRNAQSRAILKKTPNF
jgi:hypothetical protein